MQRGTQAIIAAVLVALGAGALALGLLEDESDVRYVADLLADPGTYQTGTYTLLGVPQPPEVPATAAGGQTVMEPNPSWTGETRTVASVWSRDGVVYQSVHVLSVSFDVDGDSHWTFRNETRVAGQAELTDARSADWTVRGPHKVFLIQGFPDGRGEQPLLWGVLRGPLKDPMQPKPSQFEGRLMTHLDDGTPLPDGALVYAVDEYTAGCSSKFLPPEAREKYGNATDDGADTSA